MEPDANLQGWQPWIGQVLGLHGRLHLQAHPMAPAPPFNGPVYGIEESEDGVSQKVHDDAPMPLDHLDHPGEVAIDQMNVASDSGFRPGGEAPDIGEQDYHFPFLSAHAAGLRPAKQFSGDLPVNVAPKVLLMKSRSFRPVAMSLKLKINWPISSLLAWQGFAVISLGY